MTIKQAKDEVRELGFTLNKNEYGEYVLRTIGNRPYEVEYFGGDIQDSVETAHAITGR